MFKDLESRRRFLSKLPQRVAALTLVTPAVITGCAGKKDPMISASTQAEKEIAPFVSSNLIALNHPEVTPRAAVVIAQYHQERGAMDPILQRYDEIKAPYRSRNADYSIAANLAYAAQIYGYPNATVLKLFEGAKSWGYDPRLAGDIATLAMAHGGDLQEPDNMFSHFSAKLPVESAITMTSIALNEDLDMSAERLNKISGSQRFLYSHTPAILALGSSVADEEPEKVKEAYNEMFKYDIDSFMKVRTIINESVAILAIAAVVGKHNTQDVVEMFKFARGYGFNIENAARLILGASARKSGKRILSRIVPDPLDENDIHDTIIPIALS